MTNNHDHREMFANRLRKSFRHRRRWASKVPTEAYRLYDRDIPEIPVIVDRYGDHLLVADARHEGQLESCAPDWLDTIADAAREVAGVDSEAVHIKRRERQRGTSQYERLEAESAPFVVCEQGLRFEVDLDTYLDTGLFLDHRPLRKRIREMFEAGAASGGDKGSFLNLFAYTGSFTVYALAGGAASATTVDLSNTYLEWGRRNLALNDLADARDERVREDTFTFLRDARAAGRRWDLVVVDPPTFSNSKRLEGTFDVQRDHRELLTLVGDVLTPSGTAWFSTNRRSFALECPVGLLAEETTEQTVPDDFKQKRPHRSWRLTHA